MAHATNDISSVRNVVGPGIMYPSDTLITLTFISDYDVYDRLATHFVGAHSQCLSYRLLYTG